MNKLIFDGGLSIADIIALNCIMEDLPKEHRDRFIKEYKEEDPEEWEEYMNYRKSMGYPEL